MIGLGCDTKQAIRCAIIDALEYILRTKPLYGALFDFVDGSSVAVSEDG